MFSLICVWINGWLNNRQAGDLRRHRGHYDVNVMKCSCCFPPRGGYLIKPRRMEFAQSKPNFLMDRVQFRRKTPEEVLNPDVSIEGDDGWIIERLTAGCWSWSIGLENITWQKSGIVIMPILRSLVAPEVVLMTTFGSTSDDRVNIMMTLGFLVSFSVLVGFVVWE